MPRCKNLVCCEHEYSCDVNSFSH
uniref:Uncharacterized protein n=1 Tax=Rhizophora mucronata TaxID=61149 RepID=A0A2P2ND53_RHIMU